MKVLITGASGFSGIHMIEFLSIQEDISIIGLARKIPKHFSNAQKISWVEGNILNPDKIVKTISAVNPDVLIHLAGLNHGTLQELQKTNVNGTQNILDATLRINPDCRILAISSSAVYGYAGITPITENQILTPLSEYGISKAAQETLCQMYNKTKGCLVAVARPFNVVGPHQPPSFVCGRIVQQAIEIEKGKRKYLDLHEIQSCRDFIDIRDVVKAYWMLLVHTKFKEDCAGKAFNIGSGKTSAISTVINLLSEITGKEYQLHLSASSPLIVIPSQRSDNSHIHRIIGWKPHISLKKSLSDMLNATRKDLQI
jgi:GDP-4-dehydro-6-deoxy-D-mannose reductase